jgi:hypothetical protein
MKALSSTREAARRLGISLLTLQRHATAQTVAAPAVQKVGGIKIRLWSDRDIEKAREDFAGTKPGRKKKK